MNDDDPNSSPDLNPCWDYAEPECRWAPQCHLLLIPGACEECESLNADPLWDEYGDPIGIPDDPPDSAS